MSTRGASMAVLGVLCVLAMPSAMARPGSPARNDLDGFDVDWEYCDDPSGALLGALYAGLERPAPAAGDNHR